MEQTLACAEQFLYDLPKFTTKNSLAHTKAFLRRLGSPCRDKKVIHVAGSNGKGSVCAALYHMLLAGGYSTALFTSPHLVDIRERYQINGALVSEGANLQAVFKVKEAAQGMVAEGLAHPTFFEMNFAIGLVLFEEAGAEYLVLETGLGGRLDATNCFPNPLLTVLTPISLEHTDILGDSISAIAEEKAGILKEGVCVVFWDEDEAASAVIRRKAKALAAPCIGVSPEMIKLKEIGGDTLAFSMGDAYDGGKCMRMRGNALWQAQNAALALVAAAELQLLSRAQMRRGLAEFSWPGRMMQVEEEIYLDGAHNPAGIAAFTSAAAALAKEDAEPPLLLFSMVRDKDVEGAVKTLAAGFTWGGIIVSRVEGERGMDAEALGALFVSYTDAPVTAVADIGAAFRLARQKKKKGQHLFCTGSLYFVGALLKQL